MNKTWIAFIAFATYGSLWPFAFEPVAVDSWTFEQLLVTTRSRYGTRDLVSNVLLFIPIGLLGMFGRRCLIFTLDRIIRVVSISLILALLLQIAQIFIRGRQPDLHDVVWNAAGVAVGIGSAWLLWRSTPRHYWRALDLPLIPALILASWAAFNLAPFIPSLKWPSLLANIRPLLTFAPVEPLVAAHHALGWLLTAVILRHASPARLDRLLPLAIGLILVMQVLIERNPVLPSEVIGAAGAALAWHGWLGRRQSSQAIVATALASFIILDGFTGGWAAGSEASSWLPFASLADDTRLGRFLWISNKAFLFASLVYLLRQTTRHWISGLALAAIMSVMAIWVARLGHPLDPGVLVILVLMLLFAMPAEHATSRPAFPSAGQGPGADRSGSAGSGIQEPVEQVR